MRRLALSDSKTLLLYHIQKWIPGRTVKGPSIKFSEDNIQEYQCNLKVGKNFLTKKYHALSKKEKKLINWNSLVFLYVKIYQKAKCNKHKCLYTYCFCVSMLLIWSSFPSGFLWCNKMPIFVSLLMIHYLKNAFDNIAT